MSGPSGESRPGGRSRGSAREPGARTPLATAGLILLGWVLILGVVVGVGRLLTHSLTALNAREDDLSRWFEQHRTGALTTTADALTTPGNTVVALAVGLALAVALVVWRRDWRAALFVVLGIGGVYAIYVLAFTLDHRDRPPVKILDPGLVPNHSFPSGHVAAATFLSGAVAVLARGYLPALSRWLVPLLALVPPAVLVSRLYLGAHHLTDTVTSLLFAGAWLLVLVRLLGPGGSGHSSTPASVAP